VPPARGLLGALDALSLWFSLGISLLVLQAGAFLVAGLSLPMGLLAIVIGSGLGVLLLACAGVVGAEAYRPHGRMKRPGVHFIPTVEKPSFIAYPYRVPNSAM